MASLKHNCPKCGKPARIQSEFPFPVGKLINYVYACGHMELRERIKVEDEAPLIETTQNEISQNFEAVFLEKIKILIFMIFLST